MHLNSPHVCFKKSQYTDETIVFGRILPGWLSDYAGPLTTMTLVSGLSAIAMLVIWLPLNFYPNYAGIVFFAAVYGLSCGGCMSLASPCVAALAKGKVHDLGVKMGIACSFMAIGYGKILSMSSNLRLTSSSMCSAH